MSPLDAAHRDVEAKRRAMETAQTPAERDAAIEELVKAEQARGRLAAELEFKAGSTLQAAVKAGGRAVGQAVLGAVDEVSHREYADQNRAMHVGDLAEGFNNSGYSLDAASGTLESAYKHGRNTVIGIAAGVVGTAVVGPAAAAFSLAPRAALALEAGVSTGLTFGGISAAEGNDLETVGKDSAKGFAGGFGLALVIGGVLAGAAWGMRAYRARQLAGAKTFPNQSPQFLAAELAEAAALGVQPQSGVAAIESLAGQRIKWAVTEAGDLVVIPHSPAMGVELSHAVLSGGKPVRAAGEALVVKTESGLEGVFISSHSGHFFKGKSAEAAAALSVGESAFEALGITFSRRITP